VKRYQSPLDAAHLPKNELNHNFAEDSEPAECPDNAYWINELPHTTDGPIPPRRYSLAPETTHRPFRRVRERR